MVYCYYNKETQQGEVFGSITSVCAHTPFKKDKLYYHFGRLNKSVYEDDIHYIRKTTIKRTKHSYE